MTYGDYMRKNIGSSKVAQMIANINATPLSFNDKQKFASKEMINLDDFEKDLADFIVNCI